MWLDALVCGLSCCCVQMTAKKCPQNLPHAIFVYGTLKRGQPNHKYLETFGNRHFFGTGCTELKYPLVIDRDSNLPFLLDAPGNGQVCRFWLHYAVSFSSFCLHSAMTLLTQLL